jgi:vitamin B12 transporter
LADDGEYQINREFVGYTGLNAALLDGRLQNRFGFSFTDNRNSDFNPANAPFSTLTFLGKGRTERVEYQGNLRLVDGLQAVFGAEHEYSRYFVNDGFGDLLSGRETTDSGYGQLVWTPLKGLTATGGVRYDHHSQFGDHTTGAGSLVYSPNDGLTTLRASYTGGFKAPALYQLYSNYGNAALRPETSQGWDAGITQRTRDGRFEASATYFSRDSKNLILFVNCPIQTGICANRPFGTYNNVDRARAQGVELTAAVKPVDAFRISANYTFLDARDRSPGKTFDTPLARRPANSISVNADYDWAFGLATGATLTHVSSSYNLAGASQLLQGYVLAGLRASYPIGKHLEIYGRIDNLFDAHYETTFQYGQPGRAAYGGVRLKL